MEFRKSRRIMSYLVIGGGVIAVAACIFAPTKLIFGLCLIPAAALMVVGFVIGGKYYKCPYCGKTLMMCRGSVPPRCPHCDREL